MPVRGWALIAVRDPLQRNKLRKAIAQHKIRATCVDNIKDCHHLCSRRGFFCAVIDRHLLKGALNKCFLSSPTYVVALASGKEITKLINHQKDRRIHDCLREDWEEWEIAAMLQRSQQFVSQATQLESIRKDTEKSVREDASLLCAGSWAKTVDRWIHRVRKKNDPLLIAGEDGCGQHFLARLEHYSSTRASSPFVLVQCAQRKPEDLEREIFGEIPPRNRPIKQVLFQSKFSLASQGTLLFDKADLLPRRIQLKLARAITSSQFSPLGGGDRLPLEARLIFTMRTNGSRPSFTKVFQKDLGRLVKNSILHIPPLRNRKDDLTAIVKNVLAKIRREFGTQTDGITDRAMDLIKNYSWPGNIRELEGILWASSIHAGHGNISLRVLTPLLSTGEGAVADEESAIEELIEQRLEAFLQRFGVDQLDNLHPMVLERVEKPLLRLVLKRTQGNQIRAAKALGINRNTLRRKITQYNLRPQAVQQSLL